ncbi:MAG: agmatine deiminase family protein [Myxococcales bacterium]|nr:agmatine deiminase family protein [Myxococcales bacterium]
MAWKVEPLQAGGTLNSFFASIIRATWGVARIDMLVSHPDAEHTMKTVLRTLWHDKAPSGALDDRKKIRFLPLETDSQWVRDFGPQTIFVDDKKRVFIDPLYSPDRPNDDKLPGALAMFYRLESLAAPFHLDGGNLLSNGRGDCFTSVVDGAQQLLREDRQYRAEQFRDYFGCRRTYFIHPLSGEWTGHVDVLMTVVGPRDLLIAEYAKGDDAFNSGILERNVRFLRRQLDRHGKPRFRIHRLRIPSNRGGFWLTYLNLQIVRSAADPTIGVILVPVYARFPKLNRDALRTIQTLFHQVHPTVKWRVEPIDSDLVIQSSGAIHCVLQRIPTLKAKP